MKSNAVDLGTALALLALNASVCCDCSGETDGGPYAHLSARAIPPPNTTHKRLFDQPLKLVRVLLLLLSLALAPAAAHRRRLCVPFALTFGHFDI
jgi:hypothetical protein